MSTSHRAAGSASSRTRNAMMHLAVDLMLAFGVGQLGAVGRLGAPVGGNTALLDYVAEDGTTLYVAEDGTTLYVTER